MSQIKTARTSGVAPHIPVIEPLSISENGTYTAPEGVDGYSPVTVDVPNTYTASDEGKVVSSGALVAQTTRTVTENGTYDTTTNNSVVVDVQEQPWEPLEDGYSNFWFELTDDTLSPWLNFSAKTESAVINWGDGSGEVALDTLTPTHTYTKAGKYVVKVKGVTGIGRQHNTPYQGRYLPVLKYIELAGEVTATSQYSFFICTGLTAFVAHNDSLLFTLAAFRSCSALTDATIPEDVTTVSGAMFYDCRSLTSITIPSDVTLVDSSAFRGCVSLSEIHCTPTTPPTLGASIFYEAASDFIIYVPVGTLSAYQSAWSAYADHIVEEGQTLSKAALRRIQAAEKNEGDDVR